MKLENLLHQILDDGITIEISINIQRTAKPGKHTAKCNYCGWSSGYDSPQSAQRGLRSHQQHCTAYAEQSTWIAAMQQAQSQED